MRRVILVLLILVYGFCYSQTEDSELREAYEDYTELTREQVYVHLNKSVYIKGETLWFNTYVFSKDSKLLSADTTNLYCMLLDTEGNIVSQKMIMINQGIGRGDIAIDSTYSSGEYRFKVFTNWMRNFGDEHNYFEEKIRIIDPVSESIIKPKEASKTIDIQVLAESGHFLMG